MSENWVVVYLQYADNISSDIIVDNLKSILSNLEIFIPSIKAKDKRKEYTYSLFEGYAFVRGPYQDKEFFKLKHSPYVNQILTTTLTSGKISYVSNLEIEVLKSKLNTLVPSEFIEGTKVNIVQGIFSGLDGIVIGIEDEKLMVEIQMPLGSLTKLTRIPKMFVKNI